ncbi:MAG: F0F1 ATP synthase subunit B [Acholeplasmatales bacterium]|nr:F0F1 ATP synthase subunit B [Acholeplasmatales bacterium]
MILSLDDTLKEVGEFVQNCLGPLSADDFAAISKEQWLQWFSQFMMQLVATFVLFLLVKFLLWKPITNMLEARKGKIDEELNQARETNAKAQALKEDLEKQLAEAQDEVRRIIQSAEMDGNARKEEIINAAKEEAKARLEASKQDILREVSNKQQEIKNEIVTIAFEAASKIVEHEVDREKYLDVVNSIIEGAEIK